MPNLPHAPQNHCPQDAEHAAPHHPTPPPRGRGAYIASIAGAGVLGALATLGISTCSKNNSQGNRFDPINTR